MPSNNPTNEHVPIARPMDGFNVEQQHALAAASLSTTVPSDAAVTVVQG